MLWPARIYIDHDVMHGATFPVYEWQRFLTHPFLGCIFHFVFLLCGTFGDHLSLFTLNKPKTECLVD